MGAEAAVAPDEMSFSWIKYQSKSGIVNFCVRNSGCTFLSPRLILSESECWRITLETVSVNLAWELKEGWVLSSPSCIGAPPRSLTLALRVEEEGHLGLAAQGEWLCAPAGGKGQARGVICSSV